MDGEGSNMRMFVIVVIVAVLGRFAPALSAQDAKRARPNVIIFLADDLGYADIGMQGLMKDVKTPNVDAIAKSGVRFTNGYVTCPVCAPTRAALLTGRYQQRFGFERTPVRRRRRTMVCRAIRCCSRAC